MYPTRITKRGPHTTKADSANYTEPVREFNALWKSYEDLSRAMTASSLVKPIAINCFTTSTSSLSVGFSWGGDRYGARLGIGGGLGASSDFFFFPNGSLICARKFNQQSRPIDPNQESGKQDNEHNGQCKRSQTHT